MRVFCNLFNISKIGGGKSGLATSDGSYSKIVLCGGVILCIGLSCVLTSATKKNVFICTGSASKTYHATDSCKGLKSCTADIKVITLNEAKKLKRKPCKLCYPKKKDSKLTINDQTPASDDKDNQY